MQLPWLVVLPNGLAPLGWGGSPRGYHKGSLGEGNSRGLTRVAKTHPDSEIQSQLTFALMTFIAKQLRAAEDAIPQDDITSPPNNPPSKGGICLKRKN